MRLSDSDETPIGKPRRVDAKSKPKADAKSKPPDDAKSKPFKQRTRLQARLCYRAKPINCQELRLERNKHTFSQMRGRILPAQH